MQRPSLGRIVWYRQLNGDYCAAIISCVNRDGTVNLHLFQDPPDQPFWVTAVSEAQYPMREDTRERWCWPPRVE